MAGRDTEWGNFSTGRRHILLINLGRATPLNIPYEHELIGQIFQDSQTYQVVSRCLNLGLLCELLLFGNEIDFGVICGHGHSGNVSFQFSDDLSEDISLTSAITALQWCPIRLLIANCCETWFPRTLFSSLPFDVIVTTQAVLNHMAMAFTCEFFQGIRNAEGSPNLDIGGCFRAALENCHIPGQSIPRGTTMIMNIDHNVPLYLHYSNNGIVHDHNLDFGAERHVYNIPNEQTALFAAIAYVLGDDMEQVAVRRGWSSGIPIFFGRCSIREGCTPWSIVFLPVFCLLHDFAPTVRDNFSAAHIPWQTWRFLVGYGRMFIECFVHQPDLARTLITNTFIGVANVGPEFVQDAVRTILGIISARANGLQIHHRPFNVIPHSPQTSETTEGTKKALLIGISNYVHCPRLHGAGDAAAWFNFFRLRRFSEITILRNEEATRENIIANIRRLITTASTNDTIVIQFSGHGQRVRGDTDWYESMVTWDGNGLDGARIYDKEISVLLSELCDRSDDIVMIFDCCFSGSLTREVIKPDGTNNLGDANLGPLCVARYVSPVEGIDVDRILQMNETGRNPVNYVSMAACYPNMVAWDINGQGCLTRHLIAAMQEVPTGTYHQVFEIASKRVTAEVRRVVNSEQKPIIEGRNMDRFIFEPGLTRPKFFLRGRLRAPEQGSENIIVLNGGRLQGVTIRSQWQCSTPWAPVSRQDPIIRIFAVFELTAQGRVISGSNFHDEMHCREVRFAVPDTDRVRIEIQIQDEQLQRTIQERPDLVTISEDSEPDDLLITAVKEQFEIRNRVDGSLAAPTVPRANSQRIIQLITHISKYRLMLRLENTLPDTLIRDVDLRLFIRHPDSLEEQLLVADERGFYRMRPDEIFQFRIINNSGQDIYPYILQADESGKAELDYPAPGAVESLMAGGERSLQYQHKVDENRSPFVPDRRSCLVQNLGDGYVMFWKFIFTQYPINLATNFLPKFLEHDDNDHQVRGTTHVQLPQRLLWNCKLVQIFVEQGTV